MNEVVEVIDVAMKVVGAVMKVARDRRNRHIMRKSRTRCLRAEQSHLTAALDVPLVQGILYE